MKDISTLTSDQQKLIESEHTYRGIFNSLNEAVYILDAQGHFLDVNQGAVRMYGFEHDYFIGKTPADLSAPDRNDFNRIVEQLNLALNGEPQSLEFWAINSRGRAFPKEVHLYPGDYFSQQVVIAVARDITDRKKFEQQLLRSEERVREVVEQASDGIFIADIHGKYTDVNSAGCQMLGYARDEIIGKTILDLIPPEEANRLLESKAEMIKGDVHISEWTLTCKDGTPLPVEVSANILPDGQWQGFVRDISDRKKAEQELHLAKFVMDHAPLNITFVDADARIRYLNKTGCETLGYTPEEVLNLSIPDIDPLFTMEVWNEHWQDLKQNISVTIETEHQRKNGERFPIEVIANYLEFGDKVYNVAFDREISESKKKQVALENERMRFRTLFESSNDGLFILNMQGGFIDLNRTAYERLGYSREEMLSMSVSQLDPPEFAAKVPERMAQIMQHGEAVFESAHYRKDGSIMPVEINARVLELDGQQVVFSNIRDISERKQFEEQLRQSQKMEAIGTLVGGIAHDFNNMLAAIQGNLYLAKLHTQPHSTAAEKLSNIEQLGNRAAEMVQQLLTFARKDSINIHVFSLNTFMHEGYKLASAAIPENIDHQTSVCEQPLHIRGDATQLQQVLMNLLNNAVDATAEISEPRIRCSLEPFTADWAFNRRNPELEGEHFACITIKDNGHGIAAEHLNSVFEPFYTTKEVGKGTGMGLAMTYGAIQTHKGTIEVESKEGTGTAFRVYLPITAAEIEQQPEEIVADAESDGETIILVDDNENLRRTTHEVLQSMGYTVLEASDGKQALDLYQQQREKVSMIISDIVMPKMSGIELLDAVHHIDDKLPVILITGYDKEAVLGDHTCSEHCLLLNKPFGFEILSQAIRTMLKSK